MKRKRVTDEKIGREKIIVVVVVVIKVVIVVVMVMTYDSTDEYRKYYGQSHIIKYDEVLRKI